MLTTRRVGALAWVALLLIVVLGVQPLWGLQSLWGALPAGHDTLLHFYRIPVVSSLVARGVPYSRWSPDLMLGYGYPLFQYYPPLSAYLITGLYWLVGQQAPLAMGLAFGLSIGLAGLGMFLLGRRLYGPLGGVMAAAGYVLSPHLLYQTYERGSISGALAMGLFPLALHGVLRYAAAPSLRRAALAALAVAGVVLSHAAASLVFVAPLCALGLTAAWARRPARRSVPARLAGVTAVVALGLALSAFFWLPALVEVDAVRYAESVAAPDVHWSLHFARALAWPEPPIDGLANPPLPQSAGVAQTALGTASALVAGWRLLRARRLGVPPRGDDLLALLFGTLGLGAVFLASPGSAILWRSVPLLRQLQFPWRCLDAAAILLPLGGAALVAHRAGADDPRRAPVALQVAAPGVLVVLALNALPYVYPPRHTSLPARPTLAGASAYQTEYRTYGLTSWGEYLPVTVPEPPQAPATPGADLAAPLDAKLRRDALPEGALLASRGGPLWAEFDLYPERETPLTLDTYWFPGWRARLDGRPIAVEAADDGCLRVVVPGGEHELRVYWGLTPLRLGADAVSALGALTVMVLALLGPRLDRRWHVRDRPAPPGVAGPPGAAPLLGAAALLAGFVVAKVAVLDRYDTPLVRRAGPEGIASLEAPPWGTVAGGVELVGYRLTAPDRLELYWRALRTPTDDYVFHLHLSETMGAEVATVTRTHPGLSLTSRWEPGALVRDEYALPLEPERRPIAYHLALSATTSDGEPLPISDAPAEAAGRIPLGTTRLAADGPPGAPERTVEATFGGAIRLLGVTLQETVRQGKALPYALWWRSLQGVPRDLTVFVHLVDGQGNVASGDDGPPREGLYPTSLWAPGETVVDGRAWRADVPPGDYTVRIGLYDPETLERLGVSDVRGGDVAVAADYVDVGEIRVTP